MHLPFCSVSPRITKLGAYFSVACAAADRKQMVANTSTAHIPLFLYPFLNTTSKSRPFEYLRLTSLGVIGALVKNDSTEVINFLLTTEIIPLCLRIMETGSELSKTVAIFIVQKILLDDTGLGYICHTYERFYAVGTVLSNMVTQLVEQQTVRLLKHVVRCFLRYVDQATFSGISRLILSQFERQCSCEGSLTPVTSRTAPGRHIFISAPR